MTHASDIREQTLLSYAGSSAALRLANISARQDFWCEVPAACSTAPRHRSITPQLRVLCVRFRVRRITGTRPNISEHHSCGRDRGFTRRSWHDSRRAPFEQLRAQFRLQRGDLQAERGLCNMHESGSA